MEATPQDFQAGENFKKIYAQIFSDIIRNKNLEKHLSEVNGAIEEINSKIESLTSQRSIENFLSIKNDLWALKYEILERI